MVYGMVYMVYVVCPVLCFNAPCCVQLQVHPAYRIMCNASCVACLHSHACMCVRMRMHLYEHVYVRVYVFVWMLAYMCDCVCMHARAWLRVGACGMSACDEHALGRSQPNVHEFGLVGSARPQKPIIQQQTQTPTLLAHAAATETPSEDRAVRRFWPAIKARTLARRSAGSVPAPCVEHIERGVCCNQQLNK